MMRYRLADMVGETHEFTATFNQYSQSYGGHHTVLLQDVCLCEDQSIECMAYHLWVHRTKQMKNLKLEKGERIRFEATVDRYPKGTPYASIEDRQWDYELKQIRDVRRLTDE